MMESGLQNKHSVFISCKDHTVSNEQFNLLFDPEKQMLETFPKPEVKKLAQYYQSEEYISHTDSRNSLLEKMYHRVKKHMLLKKLRWVERMIPEKGTLLDIGAGTGDFLSQAKNRGWEVHGIEPNKSARSRALEKGITLAVDSHDFQSEKFDVITMWHVLEHVYDLKSQIIELEHLLKKNGVLVIAVPNYRSYDAQYYKEFWAGYDVPRHLWHFSQKSFKHLFSGNGLKQTNIKPLIFDSFYVSLLSEKYKTGRVNVIKAFTIGFVSNLKARSSTEYSSLVYFFQKTK